MLKFRYILLLSITLCLFAKESNATPSCRGEAPTGEGVDVQKIIFGHLLDSYHWEIGKFGDKEVALYLPVILYSKETGWHFFSSKRLCENNGNYEGFYIAGDSEAHPGKLVERLPEGLVIKPIDLSLTKMSLAVIINSLLLLLLIVPVAMWYKRDKDGIGVPGKWQSVIEMVVMTIEDSVIKPCVGDSYRKFSPYLLTAFFFILLNNLMALIPIFPAGVGVTANITITMFLAVCTFIAVNVWGTKSYWKEILWPDVPMLLKCPLPIMPIIELFGIFTKPIALMIRLFANMLSGHMAMLVITTLVFIGFSVGSALGSGMTFLSVVFNVFMNVLELLVAFIQAYVFTLLSAVFVGIAQEKPK